MKGNMKRLLILSFVIICTITFLSCTSDNAKELYDTAQFEELQKNQDHANKIYEEIIEKYPDSEYAGKAKERLK